MLSEKLFTAMLSEAKGKEEERLLMDMRQYIDERLAEVIEMLREEMNHQAIEILLKDANRIFKR